MPTVIAKYSGKFLPTVAPSQAVAAGDTLCQISAWLIKLRIVSPCDGVVAKMYPSDQEDVKKGDPLFDISPAAQPGGVIPDA